MKKKPKLVGTKQSKQHMCSHQRDKNTCITINDPEVVGFILDVPQSTKMMQVQVLESPVLASLFFAITHSCTTGHRFYAELCLICMCKQHANTLITYSQLACPMLEACPSGSLVLKLREEAPRCRTFTTTLAHDIA